MVGMRDPDWAYILTWPFVLALAALIPVGASSKLHNKDVGGQAAARAASQDVIKHLRGMEVKGAGKRWFPQP